MNSKNSDIEQLDTNQEDNYHEGNSRKSSKNTTSTFNKILIFITISSVLLCLYLIYLLNTKKNKSFLELAESRFSLRHFSPKEIEPEKISKLLRVAQVAPTAENLQPQKIYIITKEEHKNKLKTVTKYTFNAPMFFLVCCDKNIAWKHKTEEYISTEIDGSLTIAHIILEAHELGLGSVVVRSFETQKIKDLFGIPDNMVPIALLPIGYPKEGAKPAKWHFNKKNIEEMVEYL